MTVVAKKKGSPSAAAAAEHGDSAVAPFNAACQQADLAGRSAESDGGALAEAEGRLRVGQWVTYWFYDDHEGLIPVPAMLIAKAKTGGWNINLHKLGAVVPRMGALLAGSPAAGRFTVEG